MWNNLCKFFGWSVSVEEPEAESVKKEKNEERAYVLVMTESGAVYCGFVRLYSAQHNYWMLDDPRKLLVWSNLTLLDISVNGIKNGRLSATGNDLFVRNVKESMSCFHSVREVLMGAPADEWINKDDPIAKTEGPVST